jgi:hypothetical protein
MERFIVLCGIEPYWTDSLGRTQMPEIKVGMIVCGAIGGLIPDILRIIQNRYDASIPEYLKSGKFYLSLFFLLLIGGALAWILGASEIKQALAYGFGGPEVISRLLGRAAGNGDRGFDRGSGRGKFKILDFWAA